MSRFSTRPRAVRAGLSALTLLAGLVGVVVGAGPAYADDHIQIADSADPVTVNTAYDYIVTIPDPLFEGGFGLVTIDLSGATATFTGITSNNPVLSCSVTSTHAECFPTNNPGTNPITITATVLPTATGTVTADTVLEGMGPLGSDTTTTEITAAPGGPPAITSISPAQGPVTGGTQVTINGEHLRDTINCGGTPDVFFGTTLSPGPYAVHTDTTIVATAPAHAAETVHITIDYGTNCETAPTSADLYTYVNPASADLSVTVTAQPHLGILVSYLTYTLTAHNTGPSAVTSATLTASLPPGAGATNLSTGCTTTTGTVTCTYGTIANGARTAKSFRVPLHLFSLGQVSVTGVRTASTPTDPNPANDTATASCTVISILLATCP